MAKPKQIQTNFRTTPEMKQRLEEAAEANGLTFNKEVNRRLAASFEMSLPEPLAGDPVLFAMMIMVAKAMKKTAAAALMFKDVMGDGKNQPDWHSDPYTYARAVDAAVETLGLMKPEGTLSPPEVPARSAAIPDELEERYESMVSATFAEVGRAFGRGEALSVTATTRDEALRKMLGPAVLERIQRNLERLA